MVSSSNHERGRSSFDRLRTSGGVVNAAAFGEVSEHEKERTMRKLSIGALLVTAAALGAGRAASTQPTPAQPAAPTVSKCVEPFLYSNCVACHQPDSMAPMSLLDYKDARPYARAIRSAVETRKMPPWFADPAQAGRFANEMHLSDGEIDTIRA